MPFVRPLTKFAATPDSTAEIPGAGRRGARVAITPHTGPDVPRLPARPRLQRGGGAGERAALLAPQLGAGADGDAIERAGALLARGRAAGDHGRHEPLLGPRRGRAAGARRGSSAIPVFLNGLGARLRARRPRAVLLPRARRGAEGRRRRARDRRADGLPARLRRLVRRRTPRSSSIDVAEPLRAHPRPVAAELYGALPATLDALRSTAAARRRRDRAAGSRSCAPSRRRSAPPRRPSCNDERAPLHPMRVYSGLAEVIDRNAIVIGDGGDFVSYAGRVVDSYEPGCWLDPGPFGCLGSGPGYALAAKLARPGPPGRAAARRRRVRLLAGWSSTRSRATASTSSA